MPRPPKSSARTRSTVEWGAGPPALRADLRRFNARARGARVRHLAWLGLLAEQHGASLTRDGQGLVLPSVESGAPARAVPPPPVGSPPVISAGLARLADAFGADTFGF